MATKHMLHFDYVREALTMEKTDLLQILPLVTDGRAILEDMQASVQITSLAGKPGDTLPEAIHNILLSYAGICLGMLVSIKNKSFPEVYGDYSKDLQRNTDFLSLVRIGDVEVSWKYMVSGMKTASSDQPTRSFDLALALLFLVEGFSVDLAQEVTPTENIITW